MNRGQLAERPVKRSQQSYWTSLLLLAIALTIPIVWVQHLMKQKERPPAPAPRTKQVRNQEIPIWLLVPLASGGIFGCAIVCEQTTRKQLALARRGVMTEGTVESVSKIFGDRRSRSIVRWIFTADDGHEYGGKCTINEIDALALASGSQVVVYYDENDPDINRIENDMWAVEWVDGPSDQG